MKIEQPDIDGLRLWPVMDYRVVLTAGGEDVRPRMVKLPVEKLSPAFQKMLRDFAEVDLQESVRRQKQERAEKAAQAEARAKAERVAAAEETEVPPSDN